MPLLFVYGTLKQGCANHGQIAAQRFVGPARTAPGWRLANLGEYPGLVRDAAGTRGIRGELWEVDAAALPALDRFEGVPQNLYTRETIALAEPAGTSAFTYVYARPAGGFPSCGEEWTE